MSPHKQIRHGRQFVIALARSPICDSSTLQLGSTWSPSESELGSCFNFGGNPDWDVELSLVRLAWSPGCNGFDVLQTTPAWLPIFLSLAWSPTLFCKVRRSFESVDVGCDVGCNFVQHPA
ncbi:hypothetical protein H6P81_017753 [Aristolochia fimbriata]|uniref:Uncharacterized protein n=1 Tax=Aristolochia fimbriata TaxID=158543 RepID=A0AAV7E031_ARIFI|nr:hypothetical protein H6P81_017753 [Aristolochia fimbriata]